MPIILSHRGNIAGPCAATENRLPAMAAALRRGWGVETDIRRDPDGRFYISHDPRPSSDGFDADAFCALFHACPKATIALNIKERGDEEALIAWLGRHDLMDRLFLFDMELVERTAGETARRFRMLDGTVTLAARVSDRGEPIERALDIGEASVIWLDEFDSPWCTERDVRRMKDAGRLVYAVSPDLHGGSLGATRARWMNFIQWGVDGICTDYPETLERLLHAVGWEAA
jgi:glycerophosphoryl diester phosphodiesterase